MSFNYGRTAVLADISFTLHRGEILGVVGPNGSGKSTLIRLLSRLLQPASGSIRASGRSIASLERQALARMVAVVPQSHSLPDGFTVAEVIMMGRTPHLRPFQAEGKHDLSVTRQAMEMTDTWRLADRLANELSGGERQRVIIARALAQQPSILLLDEPTAHLDLSHQVAILDLVASFAHEQGLGVLIVEHDLNLAIQYCHRLVMLIGGRLFAEGTPAKVITAQNIEAVYGIEADVVPHPHNGLPVTLVARSNGHRDSAKIVTPSQSPRPKHP
ncbi:MAG: heme ABC transporter ATP-binding protein [Bacteroidetes bacterium]|nr:heme ABC transporter ATP-binding protein [Bacteroidota bacterium]MCL5027232.1 heme ABC transporter ATP-binding protein [Chloroflexota bacterium]